MKKSIIISLLLFYYVYFSLFYAVSGISNLAAAYVEMINKSKTRYFISLAAS
jgi:hypothetical protein